MGLPFEQTFLQNFEKNFFCFCKKQEKKMKNEIKTANQCNNNHNFVCQLFNKNMQNDVFYVNSENDYLKLKKLMMINYYLRMISKDIEHASDMCNVDLNI